MLQASRPPVPVGFDEQRREFDAGSVVETFDAIVGMVRRQWPIFLVVVLCTVGLGAAYIAVTPPTYTAVATMVLDARKVHAFQQQTSSAEEPLDATTVQTQVEVLKSQAIATAVVKNLQLAEDPEFVANRPALSEDQATQFAAAVFDGRRIVARVGATYAMSIGFQSRDPDKAARIANAIVDAYITDQLDAKFQSTKRASVWLQDRLTDLGAQASVAEKAVADFKAKNNIVAADGKLMSDQQLAEVNSQLVTASAATAEAKARLDRITEVMKQPLPDASVAEALHNEIIVNFRKQILDLVARRDNFAIRYGAKHQATLNLQDQIDAMRRSIADEMHKIADSSRSDYAIAQSREESLRASLSSSVTKSEGTNQLLVRLRELQSTSQSTRTLYDSFLQRYMDAVQQQSFPSTEARLITPAVRPGAPSKPSKGGVIGATLIGGLLLSFGLAVLRELADGVFRSGSQIEDKTQLNCLATLPKVKLPKQLPPSGRPEPAVRQITSQPSLARYVLDEPFSAFAEGLRSVKIAVDLANVAKRHSVIGITSTMPNEGKSTISVNFAQLAAHSGHRVLLVDADLRNPSLSRLLTPGAASGFLDIIGGRKRVADAIWTDPDSGLDVLPAGAPEKLLHTNALLSSEGARAFFAAARTHYDYIIVDLSPLAPVVDTRTTTHFIDAYLYVVEWGQTKKDVLGHVLGDAREIHDNILGVILNKADLSILGRYERHRGKSYHRKYYRKYGYMS